MKKYTVSSPTTTSVSY